MSNWAWPGALALRESNPQFPCKSTVNIILMNSSVHMLKQSKNSQKCSYLPAYRIFWFSLIRYKLSVQIKSNIRLVQKTISKISFKGDKIGWNLEQQIPQQQVFHLACVYAFGFSHTLWPFTHCEEHEVSVFIEEGGNFHCKVTPLWTRKIDPFSSFCSFDTLNNVNNTSPICEKQPLSHIFFLHRYPPCNGSPPWCYSHLMPPVTCKKQSINPFISCQVRYFINNTSAFWQEGLELSNYDSCSKHQQKKHVY